MKLQCNTNLPCFVCSTGLVVEIIELEQKSDTWRSWGYVCEHCGKKYKLSQFPENHEKLSQQLHQLLKEHYFVVLSRDLNFNEVSHHGSKTAVDKSLFKKGTVLLRSYYDDDAMRITDPEIARKGFAHGPKYILRGKNKKSVPEVNPAFSFPRGFSISQIKKWPLRRQGKKGSTSFHEHDLREKESLAAKVYRFDFTICRPSLDAYYIPLYLGKVFGRRKPTPKQKPLTNS